jgi:hypothetical protein
MNDILSILAVITIGLGALTLFNGSSSNSNSSNLTTGGRRRKTRKNLKK